MKFFVETIGCQQNVYDASRLVIFLKSAGLVEVSDSKEADVIFILTCSVRQTAVDRIFGRVKNWKHKKIITTSCLQDADKERLKEKGVIYWDYNKPKDLAEIIGIESKGQFPKSSLTEFVPIVIGCNNFCSYCVVPYLRGREVSRPINEVVAEIENLVKRGEKEITLLGQNVNSYKYGFAKLLKILNDLPGEFEIGFLTNHPKDMSDDIIEAVAGLPKVKKEIHLPLQSGSDRILKLMNRPYSSKQYLKLIENCKLKIENLVLTTDIIVGFPGETEEDFQKTIRICKKVKFNLAYINKYSPRKGTAAYKLGDPISWHEKQRRWRILDVLINKNPKNS